MPADQSPRASRERMSGKVAIVTGGASGIGRASSLLFAAEGASVLVADLDGAAAAAVAAEIGELGRAAASYALDVRDRDACFDMVRACETRLGPVDSLVCCAGIWSAKPPVPDPYLVDVTGDAVKTVLDVNLFGTLYANQAVARALRDGGRPGSIVNLASSSAKLARPTRGPYAISKAGVWMLSKIMAAELAGDGIRVNALAPGYIETPMTAAFPRDGQEAAGVSTAGLLAQTPLGRAGTAAEVAEAALFLASDDASYFTGELLQPTGGWYLG